MTDKTVWMVTLGTVEPVAQIVAQTLSEYGLAISGHIWPAGDGMDWLLSAQEAAKVNAGLVVVVGDPARVQSSEIRKSLSLFRLSLQTLVRRRVDGFFLMQGDPARLDATIEDVSHALFGWLHVEGTDWFAKAVARFHLPSKNPLPFHIGLHAHERLGVWLEISSNPGRPVDGFVVGVTGQDAKIDFHAVGPSGRLPERTVNEYELKGLKFQAKGLDFEAWGLRNHLEAGNSYYVRIQGQPDALALSHLPEDEIEEVDLVWLL